MINRLKQLRKTIKINQTNFAKQIGITQTAYSMIENGINPLSDRHIKVICSAFNVNENWLRTGEGDMFFSSPYEKEFTEIFSRLAPETQKYLLLMARELLNTQEKLLNPKGATQKSTLFTAEQQARAEAEQYYQELLEEKKAAAESAALQNTESKAKMA